VKNCQSRRFSKRGGSLSAQISEGREASPTNHCCCQNSRVIALLYGIKISAVHQPLRFVTIHMCDRQTDGRTDGWTELRLPGHPCICSRSKKLSDLTDDWQRRRLVTFPETSGILPVSWCKLKRESQQ